MQIELLEKIIKKNLPVRKIEELVRHYSEIKNGKAKRKEGATSQNLASISQKNISDRLQSIMGTKVHCSFKKNGTGEIIIEFYSQDELERLFELFEIIDKSNS